MGQVYSNARLVIAWLGPGFRAPLSTIKTYFADDPAPDDWDDFVSNMNRLTSSEYWARLWIVQEPILAKKLEIWSDDSRTPGPRA